jgi:hypothetical protein
MELDLVATRYEQFVPPGLPERAGNACLALVVIGLFVSFADAPIIGWSLVLVGLLVGAYGCFSQSIVRWTQRRALARALREKAVVPIGNPDLEPIEDQMLASRLVSMVRTPNLWSIYQIRPQAFDWCEKNLQGAFGVVPMDFMDLVERRGVRLWFDRPEDAQKFRAEWLEGQGEFR